MYCSSFIVYYSKGFGSYSWFEATFSFPQGHATLEHVAHVKALEGGWFVDGTIAGFWGVLQRPQVGGRVQSKGPPPGAGLFLVVKVKGAEVRLSEAAILFPRGRADPEGVAHVRTLWFAVSDVGLFVAPSQIFAWLQRSRAGASTTPQEAAHDQTMWKGGQRLVCADV